MEKIWEEVLSFLKIDLVQKIILCAITAFITHYFTSKNNIQKQRLKHQDTLGDKICQAYLSVREIIEECNTIDWLDQDQDISVKNIFVSMDFAVYSSFMNDKESMWRFIEKLTEVRQTAEPYVDLKTAASLYAMERYLMSLSLYIRENSLEEKYKILGCIVVVDATRWLKQLDKHVINKINKPKYRLYSKEGMIWEAKKRNAVNKYLKKSELNKLITGKSNFPVDVLFRES